MWWLLNITGIFIYYQYDIHFFVIQNYDKLKHNMHLIPNIMTQYFKFYIRKY